MQIWKVASAVGGTLGLIIVLQFAPLYYMSSTSHVSEVELNKIDRYGSSTNRKSSGRDLVTDMGETCVLGYEGGDVSTVNPFPKPITVDPLRPLNYCGEFDSGSCCSNVMAQEITDGFVHLMNVGGTGGVPIDDERCLQYAKKTFIALKDYFCLMCNPRHIKYLGCCNAQYKQGGNCADPAGKAATADLMQVYGTGTCVGKASDTIRICKTFADKLWGVDGSKYDACGMMTWIQHDSDEVADANAWSDKDANGIKNGNPAGITPWGDVDGRTGTCLMHTDTDIC
jgi:hypothetical protein